MKSKSVRLSTSVLPIHYILKIKPNLVDFTFEGSESIELFLTKPTKQIILHADELAIGPATYHLKDQEINSTKTIYNKKSEIVTFSFAKPLPKGTGKLSLSFTGVLNDKMRGFYKSKYEIDGKEHFMASTQFEATDARRAFPCFDEPDKKATFSIQLEVPSDHAVISNTIEEEVVEHASGFKLVSFSKTPKMSTYLVAFIVGKFEYVSTKTKEGTLVRIFVTPGKKAQAEFALDVASKSISFFADYFKIPYPLPVIDLIAIPDFASGAMENWGAVTYRETALLYDKANSSTHNKQWVALVIAHELAHQWFGNLVTMQWWTHLWLNEGFASYIEYLAVDHIFPQWHIWTQFVYMDHADGLELDGLENTHAIEVPVTHPSEISEIFDAVSYSKGASVIRMIAEYLGKEDFRQGLVQYLKNHSYANASTQDLWKALEKASGKPVGRIMKNWTGKPGYPLVTVRKMGDSLSLSQKRYYSSPISRKKSKDTTLWSIPVSFHNQKILLDKKSMKVRIADGELSRTIKINENETSFIRVQYSQELLAKLSVPIIKKELSQEDRFGIVRDAFNLATSGESTTDLALAILSSYKKEDSYIVWSEIASDLSILARLIENESYYMHYEAFCRELFTPIAKFVGWDKRKNEPHTTTMLRSLVLGTLGFFKDKAVIAKAQQLFKSADSLDPDIRGIVYSLVAQSGGEKEFYYFMKLYKNAPFQEEKDRILRALCRFQDASFLQKVLDFSFSSDVRAQDSFKAVAMVFANKFGKELAWKFVQEHWSVIMERFGGGHLLPRFISGAGSFVKVKYAKEIKAFFKIHQSAGIDRTVSQVVEQIYANNDWLNRDNKKIQSFLASHT